MGADGNEDEQLAQWLASLGEAGLQLAVLAVARRGNVTPASARGAIATLTVGLLAADEGRLAGVMRGLQERGYLEPEGGAFRITSAGKRYMFKVLKQWNRYVDAMNNLWGCYYGT